MNEKGLASYCQECGACAVVCEGLQPQVDDHLVDYIYEEVLKVLPPESIAKMIPSQSKTEALRIPLGVSNRHIHMTPDNFSTLFGPESSLEKYRDLYQPGDFAAEQTVTIVGSKMRAIQNVRILGPLRDYTQVEISLTDSIGLGVKPPVRNSGDLRGAAPLTLVGPKGSVYLEHVAIIASRHVHMGPRDAERFGVQDGDYIKVHVGGEKPTVFEKILVRTNKNWKLQLHLDTDEANAANVRCSTEVEFIEKM